MLCLCLATLPLFSHASFTTLGWAGAKHSRAVQTSCILDDLGSTLARLYLYIQYATIMAGQPNTGRSLIVTSVIYLVQIAFVLLVAFHNFSSKDTAIVASLLIAMYGMSTAQSAFESTISGMHFVTLARLIVPSEDSHQSEDGEGDFVELTKRETPFTFAHALLGFSIALVGAIKLAYTIFIS